MISRHAQNLIFLMILLKAIIGRIIAFLPRIDDSQNLVHLPLIPLILLSLFCSGESIAHDSPD